jgi:hypothetical protein
VLGISEMYSRSVSLFASCLSAKSAHRVILGLLANCGLDSGHSDAVFPFKKKKVQVFLMKFVSCKKALL